MKAAASKRVMAKKWTVREKREHAKEKYHEARLKLFVLFACIIVVAALIAGLYYSVSSGLHPLITAVLLIATVIAVPLAVFIIDLFWFEYA